jgi:hypothetical protein
MYLIEKLKRIDRSLFSMFIVGAMLVAKMYGKHGNGDIMHLFK